MNRNGNRLNNKYDLRIAKSIPYIQLTAGYVAQVGPAWPTCPIGNVSPIQAHFLIVLFLLARM